MQSKFGKLLLMLTTGLAFGAPCRAQRNTLDDPYSTELVSSALQFIADPPNRPILGSEMHRFTAGYPSLPQLGDEMSIAVLKILSPKQLVEPKYTHAYLLLVVWAFSDKRKVISKSNENPNITLFVLEYLKEKKADEPKIERRISYLQLCAPDFSCSLSGLQSAESLANKK